MIKLNSVVIVEGKYDKIHLSNFIDATIIATNGFGIYRDRQTQDLLKMLCNKNGAVVITDSDDAGAQIRNYIKNICNTADIKNVYLPQIKGREKRKAKPSKQGYLGAEGLSREIIEDALKKYGVFPENEKTGEKVTKTDLYVCGLSGQKNSKSLRVDFMNFLELPNSLSPNIFLDVINSLYTKDEFLKEIEKWHQDQAKN